jgi:large subunit ribosomal protein L10
LGRGCKLKREKKEQVVTEIKNNFDRAKAVIFTDYKGMTVADLSELRKLIRDNNLEYRIVKNTLAKIASSQTLISPAKDCFKGPIGIALIYDDPISALKKILEHSTKNDKLKVSGGIIEGTLCTSDDLKTYAQIPPRNVLLSMFVGGLQSPLSKLSGALRATLCKFSYVLEAIKIKKGQE